jgi:hypothetical protein
MIIAAHLLGKTILDSLLFVYLKKIARDYPYHKIIVFVEELAYQEYTNIEQVRIGFRSKLITVQWKKIKLPYLINNSKADCFISEQHALCTGLKIPQHLFISNLHFTLNKPAFIKAQELAQHIFIAEDFFKKFLTESKKAKVICGGLQTTALELSFADKNTIQNKYAEGYDYFVFEVNNLSRGNLFIALKAFSQLKKWQKTSLKILLLLNGMGKENLIPDFEYYKYKADVIFVEATSQNTAEIIASSFALILLNDFLQPHTATIAMQNNIPIIAEDTLKNKNYFSKAALLTKATEIDFANALQEMYKDEMLQKKLMAEAQNILKKYDTEKSAIKLFSLIQTP